jgi:hypothetical protein
MENEKRVLVYRGADGTLLVEKPTNSFVGWEVKIDMRIRRLKEGDVDFALVSELPDEKYREAWKLNDDLSAVVIDKEKALEIARRRATAALIACKNRMIARGRAESLRTGKKFEGLNERDEADLHGSRIVIEKSVSLRHLEASEKFFKNLNGE